MDWGYLLVANAVALLGATAAIVYFFLRDFKK